MVVERTVLTREVTASDGKTYDITVAYTGENALPRGTDLRVTELAEQDRAAYEGAAIDALGGKRVAYLRAFDITLVAPDGSEVEPTGEVSVSIRLADADATEDASVLHFADAAADAPANATPVAEVLASEATAESGAVTYDFVASSFSVYAVAYTVDFHWGDYAYSIAGESEIYLSDLLATLGESVKDSDPDGSKELLALAADLSQVKSVAFSDPKLVKVEQKAGAREPADWLLTSLKPFQTDETLTLTIKDGSKLNITVTDVRSVSVDVPITKVLASNRDLSEASSALSGEKFKFHVTVSPADGSPTDGAAFDNASDVEIAANDVLSRGEPHPRAIPRTMLGS